MRSTQPGHLCGGLLLEEDRSAVNSDGTEIDQQFRDFVAAHRDRAIGLAWRLVDGDGGAAEDVAQEAFIRAYRSLHRFRGDAKIATWFYRILVNEAHRYRRWRWVRERVSGGPVDEAKLPSAEVQGDVLLRKRVSRAMSQLTTSQRETFILVHLEGFTLAECSEVTGRAVGTCKSHLHRALGKLRNELADLNPAISTQE